MISGRSYIPVICLAIGAAALALAAVDYAREDLTAATIGLAPAEPAAGPSARPFVTEQTPRHAPRAQPRPAGLVELNFVRPDQVLLSEQRRALAGHLARVRLAMTVPDAMSYASHRRGTTHVLSAASAPGAGFFLFSEKPSRHLSARGTRGFLRDFFRDAFALSFNDHDETFLSRGAGEMLWIKGTGGGGQRFDAFLFTAKKSGFTHLLFIYDATVANASRRLMVDSLRPT